MKKSAYILGGVLLGTILTTASVTAADQVKSLIGKKVAGEYTVNVNGKILSDKAIVVNNKAHVPLRSVSDSLGGKIKIDGKTIIITTNSTSNNAPGSISNKYFGKPKTEIEASLKILKEDILKEAQDGRERVVTEINRLKASVSQEMVPFWESQLTDYDANIARIKIDIAEAEAALAAAK